MFSLLAFACLSYDYYYGTNIVVYKKNMHNCTLHTKRKPNHHHHHSMHHHKNNSRVNTSSTTAHLNVLLSVCTESLVKLAIIIQFFLLHDTTRESAIAIVNQEERRSEFIKCSVLLNRRDVTAEKLTKQHTQP